MECTKSTSNKRMQSDAAKPRHLRPALGGLGATRNKENM